MDFRLLGPLEVQWGERVLAPGGAKQRALLALLLLHANEVVPRDVLIDALWGESPPDSAEHNLESQISRLRKSLELGELLVTRPGGYALEVADENVDARRFERLLEEGRRANATGEPDDALEHLREALALWRGGALADVAYEPFARSEVERLEELRLVATEERIDAELALGHHARLVPELDALAAKHPLRERLRAQWMLALYRSGRQAEALRVYADTRRRLVDELGLEPGEPLQELERAILRHDTSLDLATPSRLARGARRPALVGALAVALAAGASAAGVLLAHGGTQSSRAQALAQPGSVALVSARTGKLLGQASVQAPVLVRFGAGALWTVSADGELTKIDPATAKVLGLLNTGVPVPCGLAVGEGSVWVTDCKSSTLVQIDPVHDVIVRRLPLPMENGVVGSLAHDVALGAGSVWVEQSDFNPSFVDRIDPRTGRLEKRIRSTEVGLGALAFGEGAVWAVSGYLGTLLKIDPHTNRIEKVVRSLHGEMCCVAAGGGFVWAATAPDRKVWKLTGDGAVVAGIPLPANVESLAYADGALWAANGEAGTVVRIDPTTNEKRTYTLGHHVFGAAAHAGVIAAGVQQSDEDATAGLTGKVVHVALRTNYLDWTSTDPAATQGFNHWQKQFQYATCAKLLNYPDASGEAGKRLVPEVAAAWPIVSDGGRTYTFRIRSGYRFSPPSGAPVTADAFRRAIERFLSPVTQPDVWYLAVLPDVVGAEAYHAGKTAHVAGVTAHGNTLSIRLVRPASDLPARLAMPAFCAVPPDEPVAFQGLSDAIPSAGPYYLASRTQNVVVLKRNPGYRGPRPHRLDAIVYELNVDAGTAAVQIEQGKVDYILEDDPALGPESAAAHAAGRRYRMVADNFTSLLALNTRRPLFADVRVRRAVEYAVDRAVLSGRGFALATSYLLPPNSPRSEEGPAYPRHADLVTARRLVGGRRLRAVFAAYDPSADPAEHALVAAVREQLAVIGIDVRVVPIRGEDDPASKPTIARADLMTVGRDPSRAIDPVDYLGTLPYLPSDDRRRLERIARLPSPRREAAAAALAVRLMREAVYVPYANGALGELVSRRLGCIVHQPNYPGVDLAALCLR
jgi:DNA-binding SARP family transcriptional activator/ABC-type transport system substrate-binding protein